MGGLAEIVTQSEALLEALHAEALVDPDDHATVAEYVTLLRLHLRLLDCRLLPTQLAPRVIVAAAS